MEKASALQEKEGLPTEMSCKKCGNNRFPFVEATDFSSDSCIAKKLVWQKMPCCKLFAAWQEYIFWNVGVLLLSPSLPFFLSFLLSLSTTAAMLHCAQ